MLYFLRKFGPILFVIVLYSCKKEISKDYKVEVEIEYIRCQYGTKGSRSLLRVNYKEKFYLVPITKTFCRTLKKGDIIELYYSENKKKVYYEK